MLDARAIQGGGTPRTVNFCVRDAIGTMTPSLAGFQWFIRRAIGVVAAADSRTLGGGRICELREFD